MIYLGDSYFIPIVGVILPGTLRLFGPLVKVSALGSSRLLSAQLLGVGQLNVPPFEPSLNRGRKLGESSPHRMHLNSLLLPELEVLDLVADLQCKTFCL